MKKAILGKSVPNFQLIATGKTNFDLQKYKDQNVILYFYPKDHTPGCTLQGHEFTKLKKDFAKQNAVVFGISRDPIASHEKFKEKQCYAIDLLSDEDEIACDIFDVVKEKNMYGKKVMGIVRSTFWINEKGILQQEWRKVKAEGHAAMVLAELKKR